MKKPFLFIIFIMMFVITKTWALESYNAYGGYAIGCTKVIAMGGAYLGVSNDIDGVIYNPAGVVFLPAKFCFGIAQSKVDNTQTDTNNDGTKDSFPLSYWYGGTVVRTQKTSYPNIAIGAAYTSPYEAIKDFKGSVNISGITVDIDKFYLKFGLNSYTIPVALQFTSDFSLGANFNIYQAEEIFQIKYSLLGNVKNYDYTQNVSGVNVDFGLMLKPTKKLSVGVVVKPSKSFDFDETMNNNLDSGSIKWFRDVVLPFRMGIGVNYKFNDKFNFSADTNYIGGQKDSILIGSKLLSSFKEYKLKDQGVLDLHLGGDYLVNISDYLKLNLRAGTYYEPSRVENLDSRWHYSGGLQFQLWRILFGLGYDKATDYSNLSMVFGLLLRL